MTPEVIKRSISNATGPTLDGKMTLDEKNRILEVQKKIYKETINPRRVEAVIVRGAVFTSKGPFFSGWVSGACGHWGIVVDGLLNHLVFELDSNGKVIGVEFEQVTFKDKWVIEGRVKVEVVGQTTISSVAIKAIGDSLIVEFQNYRKLYRNCQTFAEIFLELICGTEGRSFSTTSIRKIVETALIAIPLTSVTGTVVCVALKRSKSEMIEKTKEALSWEDLVDKQIMDEVGKIESEMEKDSPLRRKNKIMSDVLNWFSKLGQK